MIRTLALIALATSAAPALAEQPASAANGDLVRAELAATSEALEARQHLLRQGYLNVSDLNKNDQGLWTGTAMRDGKTIFVAIDIRKPVDAKATN